MIDSIVNALERMGLTPMHMVAVGLGLLVSWGGAQAIKKFFGLCGRPVALIAFLLALTATYTVAPGYGWLPGWIAVVVGLMAPTVYKILIVIARKRQWAWASVLSGDEPAGHDEHEELGT